MKIHIIGGSRSGKTYLARLLSRKYDVPVTSLDNLFWDNSAGHFNVKRKAEDRDEMLSRVLQQESWIIEGVQYAWLDQSFADADVIYVMDTPQWLCRSRIRRRFIRRKFHAATRHDETLQSVHALLKWTKQFYRVNMPAIYEKLAPHQGKVTVLRTKQELQKLVS